MGLGVAAGEAATRLYCGQNWESTAVRFLISTLGWAAMAALMAWVKREAERRDSQTER
jgi:hypothetical protein